MDRTGPTAAISRFRMDANCSWRDPGQRRTRTSSEGLAMQIRRGRLQAARVQTIAAAVICLVALVSIEAQAPRGFKTPWGDPDLQGTWSNQTLTPLERPAEFANKPVLSAAEAIDYEKRLLRNNDADVRNPGTRQDVNTAYNNVWWDRGNKIVADRRTSLIVDP